MRLASTTSLALLVFASQGSAAYASAGWTTHSQSRARTSGQQIGGTVSFVRRSTQHEADCSAPLRPHLSLRGGCSSAERSNSEAADGGGNGKVEGGDRPSSAVGDQGSAIDEDLYSRQLYVMGKTAMAKMGKADVLISGMRCGVLADCWPEKEASWYIVV